VTRRKSRRVSVFTRFSIDRISSCPVCLVFMLERSLANRQSGR
jgi:hypothetical protein